MIVKNEEKNIFNCLDRALKVVDEAIVVDTGSTDNTVKLLIDNYGENEKVKIIEYEWENDFSKARNKSLEYATGDWILVLDADERIFCNRKKLEEFLESREGKAYIIPIYNIMDRHNITISSTMIRLYKNDNPKYTGAIHEQILVDGKNYLGDVIDGNICKIYHYGYTETVFKEKDKQERNMNIIMSQIDENSEVPFHWYNKGVMEMCQGNYDTAIDDFIKAHRLSNKTRMAFHNDLVLRLLQCMLMERKYKMAIDFIKTVVNDPIIGKIPDIYYYWGIAHANRKNYSLAVKSFKKAIEIGEYEKGITKYGAGSFLPKLEWAKVLIWEKKKEEAIAKFKEAVLDEYNVNRQGLAELKYLLREENRIDELNQIEKDLLRCKTREENSINTDLLNNDEFFKFKNEVKNNIQLLIENGMLKEAKEAIKEYENIVGNDGDIYSIKGIIAMMEGNMEEAERILDEGLLIDSNNTDILYNIAYLYNRLGQINKSISFYKKLYHLTKEPELKKEVEETIQSYGKNTKYNVLIGSPVHQKPHILKEFLESLKGLSKEGIEVDYYFIDDNTNEESSKLLLNFSQYEKKVIINKSKNKDKYVCNNYTHNWKENLVWKVADFKNSIIEYARDNHYDYLFFIDSDLVLHPNTLKQLISTGKDIVSEIFWTKWKPDMPELPQVWMKDAYTQYDFSREERLDQNEINKRHSQFINKLRSPGLYEVGGLGACTLISKYAIDKGVSFKEIKNLSFWGEDRHFCVRAMALGLSLYVDTHYPAYHIYRDEDLKSINFIKERNKKKITLINTNYSGSNSIAMFKNIPDYIANKYNVKLINQSNNDEFMQRIVESDVVITTEGNYHFNKKLFNKEQKVVDLWHGFPLKAMGYADKGELFKDYINNIWENVNYIGSYSELFNIAMNKCINTQMDKYKILGAPRNDFLFKCNGKKNLYYLFNKKFHNKLVVFYMPTYRYSSRGNRKEGNRRWDNYFDFDYFEEDGFNKFLMKNDIELIIKLHPADEAYIINKIEVSSNIQVLTSAMLIKNNIDLYEILNGCDLLITDYSSAYFDLLLLDKPVIFTPTDFKEYEKNRGFLLEPYDFWTPGPKCLNQKSLEEEIIKSLSDKDYYKKEREIILNKVHYYKDGNSSERTWNFINSLLV